MFIGPGGISLIDEPANLLWQSVPETIYFHPSPSSLYPPTSTILFAIKRPQVVMSHSNNDTSKEQYYQNLRSGTSKAYKRFQPYTSPPPALPAVVARLPTTHSSELTAPKLPQTHTCNWEGCTKTFTKASLLTSHLLLHQNVRPFQCTFAGCGAAFTFGCGKQFSRSDSRMFHERTCTLKRE
ncbi:hypothetical protein BCR33DRAFT_711096 [Rhizoclosmatium globosum]|uniref:C2H2-type domain-containing protein n=1 Tax=Rhizoclosmatium globosum TaxID=329046 RepID=A0A1Y2D365_9FUNG|nr:hypothetical protein BCR33DRAFT_711096 [Rhizoclosmatium globosum]|eukprot:ORY53738.1 hypothetical protein BCR33DRAFT_711096 [Rhizoclosmatium globosum]